MKELKKINFGIIVTVILAIVFMSFITIPDKSINNETPTVIVPSVLPPASGLYVSWTTIDVDFNYSGHYVVRYSDNVGGLELNHTLSWGCGRVDVQPNTTSWDCSRSETYYYEAVGTDCDYIGVTSNSTPSPGNPAIHSLNFRVKDDQGSESNWGGITLRIFYVENPANSEPANPCDSF